MESGKKFWDREYAKIKILAVAVIFFGIFGGGRFAAAATFVSGDITTDTTWTKAESPYVVNGDVKVNSGVVLTIEPGVIVKVESAAVYPWQDTYIDIYGKLIAEGTKADKIYFTSVYDDSLGGDTNGDEDLTEPSYLDLWRVRLFNGPSDSIIKNVVVRYSSDGFYFRKTRAVMDNVEFLEVGTGVGVSGSILNASDLRFLNIYNAAFDIGFGSDVRLENSKISNDLWQAITVYKSKLAVDGLVVDDQGIDYVIIAADNSIVTIASSTFNGGLDGGIGAFNFSSVSISSSTIKDFVEEGFYIADGSRLTIDNSSVQGNENGIILANNCEGCFPFYKEKYRSFLTARGNAITYNNSFGVYMTPTNNADAVNNWWGHSSGPKNAIMNPDGLGNLISDGVNFIPWFTSDPTIEKSIDPVLIIPGILGSAEKDGVWLIDPIFHTYDDLIATLVANGYIQDQVPGQNLFSFPYDWRFSNVLTAVALKAKIAEVKNICQCEKVDLVAHSMGGLVARQYIQSSQYANDVDQLIFLGTPHLGAPKAYLPWEGATMPFNITDQGIKTLLWWEAKKLDLSLFDYIHQSVFSIRELLPIYDYLTLKDSGVVEKYPNGYPTNSFLENLSVGTNQLLNSGVTITNFVGSTGTSTISSILVASSTDPILWEHGEPDELNDGIGDETVPIGSAGFIDEDVNFFTSTHMNLPFDARGLIYEKLTGRAAEHLIGDGPFLDALMLIKIFSPADIVIIAPDNKRIGKDFATGQEVNEIAGAFYSGFGGDDEYVTILNPQDGGYRVETQGTGAGGAYTLATTFITNESSTESDFTGTTLPGMITPIDVVIDNTNPENLSVEPTDQTLPVITIYSPLAKDYIRGDIIAVNATSTDADSGVLNFETTLDGMAILASTTVDSFYQKLGNHNFFATSTDFVGNVATSSVNFRITATVKSLIKDFIRCYQLGWISTKFDRTAFINKLDKFTNNDKWTSKEKKNNEKLYKLALNVLLKLLDAQRGKHVDERAYQILSEDIKWLLANY